MSDIHILGVDMIEFGRFPETSVPRLGAQAALMALDDAGLNVKHMEALYCGNLGQAGVYDVVLAVGVEQMGKGLLAGGGSDQRAKARGDRKQAGREGL